MLVPFAIEIASFQMRQCNADLFYFTDGRHIADFVVCVFCDVTGDIFLRCVLPILFAINKPATSATLFTSCASSGRLSKIDFIFLFDLIVL